MDKDGNIVSQVKSVYKACNGNQDAEDANDIPWYQWLLYEFADKQEDYLKKFLKGNIAGGLLNFLEATLNSFQSVFLNALNAATSIEKGETPKIIYNMDYHDYTNEQKKKSGKKTIFEFTEELRSMGIAGDIAGNIINTALELLSDPAFLWSVLKSAGQGSAKSLGKKPRKVVNSADDTAKGAGKAVVIGESMAKRVIPYAQEIGADVYKGFKYYDKTRAMFGERIANLIGGVDNALWLIDKMVHKYKIVDIGIDATRAKNSPYYLMESVLTYLYKHKELVEDFFKGVD